MPESYPKRKPGGSYQPRVTPLDAGCMHVGIVEGKMEPRMELKTEQKQEQDERGFFIPPIAKKALDPKVMALPMSRCWCGKSGGRDGASLPSET